MTSTPRKLDTSRKRRIERAFSLAADTYDEAAGVQRRVAERLASLVCEDPPPVGGTLLEVGCGTGFLTERLQAALPERRWIVTDLSPAMVERCRARLGEGEGVSFRVMDGEAPDLGAQRVQAVVSSLALQWFEDLGGGIRRLASLLAPGGKMVFSIVGEGTFEEWRACLRQEGIAATSPFASRDELAGMGDILLEERIPSRHGDGAGFLRALRSLGATVPGPDHRPLPPARLRNVLDRFGGEATYHVFYVEVPAAIG